MDQPAHETLFSMSLGPIFLPHMIKQISGYDNIDKEEAASSMRDSTTDMRSPFPPALLAFICLETTA